MTRDEQGYRLASHQEIQEIHGKIDQLIERIEPLLVGSDPNVVIGALCFLFTRLLYRQFHPDVREGMVHEFIDLAREALKVVERDTLRQ
jgi:hypothetical protein